MALQIWLPLNKADELTSIGLMNNVFSMVSSPAYSQSGKLGGCYSFDGTDDNLYSVTDKTFFGGKEISYCCWLKSDQTNGGGTIMEIGSDLCLGYIYNSSGLRFTYWRCYSDNGTRAGDSKVGSTYYSSNVWHHVAITFDHQYNKLYVDGVLSQVWDSSSLYTTNWTPMLSNYYNKIAIGRSYGSQSFIGGYLNDIRIYDHCLSPKEVHEISKGLVLHYKLDNLYTEYEQLDYITFAGSQYFYINKPQGQKSSMRIEFEIEPDTLSHSQPTFFGGKNSNVQFYRRGTTELSLWTSSGSHIFGEFNQGEMNKLTIELTASSVKSNLNGYITTSTNTDAFSKLFSDTCTSFTVGAYESTSYPFFGNLSSLNLYIDNVLIFSGIPVRRVRDSVVGMYDTVSNQLFTSRGSQPFVAGNVVINQQNTIYDSSGYENNGTINGNLTVSSDTPRYKTSTNIVNSYISCPLFKFNETTISFWINRNELTDTRQFIYTGWYGISIELTSTNKWQIYYTYNSSSANVNLSLSTVLQANNWYHVVVVIGSSGAKSYINGVCEKTSEYKTPYYSNTNARIGSYSNYVNFNAKISDFRIYATALSESDILELYNTSAYIHNTGILSGFEINETADNILKYENTLMYTNEANTETRGKYVDRNGVLAMAFKATDTYYGSGDSRNSKLLNGFFKENTQYVFDLWLDTDTCVYANDGLNKSGGFYIYYTDGTRYEGYVMKGANSGEDPKGWQHRIYISTAGKSIRCMSIYYWMNWTFYVRADSFIVELSGTNIGKDGIVNSGQFIENSDTAFIGKATFNSNHIIEI